MTVHSRVMVVVRRRLRIVVVPVGRRLGEVRDLQRMLGTVRAVPFQGAVMLQGQVQAHPEGQRSRRHPAGQDEDRDDADG